MTLWELIRNEAGGETHGLVAAAVIAGAANALAIALLNAAAASSDSSEKMRSLFLILLCVVLYVFCSRRTYHRTTTLIEQALKQIKLRVVGKIERADLQGLEQLGTSEIYDRITENVSVISDSARLIANVLQSMCVLACAAVYILLLSPPAFALLVLLTTVGILRYFARDAEVGEHLAEGAKKRITFFDQMTDMLKGVKELRLSGKRSRDVREDISGTVEEVRAATVGANKLFNDNLVFVQCVLFALLITMVFVLPEHVPLDSTKVTTLVGAVLFFWSPLGGAVGGMPAYKRSGIALSNIEVLEKKLDRAMRDAVPPEQAKDPWGGTFSTIQMDDVTFAYAAAAGDHGFQIGPMSVSIARGETIFVVGGNGSGKSTFMKVLMGLYPATGGELRMDGEKVRAESVAAYREMFSVIFEDFHLFSRLYGVLDADEQLVQRLLQQMRIDDKTSYVDTHFTTRNLSTGQRKRLLSRRVRAGCPVPTSARTHERTSTRRAEFLGRPMMSSQPPR
ncbi:ATP-binding cassette domain-containing protein [Chondromyces apiculatus]|uniref:ABC transmembrane type-1 domain-containing protein n=1 Tax=Chondromyces apiculatus DSM 436 TaxID=1192034 RepID=A0A017T6E2_9BACT|nr:ATP-binding cassette domain-containing protein [Chondromyces apiculatus]EYF04552.1 Hypothetical protein CAP_4372 [Chondromyces apiculatus DSM 436]